jgi:hypothetical protein
LHVINGWTICMDGLLSCYPPRRRVRDRKIEIARSFLTQCRQARLSRASPKASLLKHVIEQWAAHQSHLNCNYVETGAVIIAALELEIAVAQVCEGSRDAVIGVNIRDVRRLTKDFWNWNGWIL